jgi:hypothetical protein
MSTPMQIEDALRRADPPRSQPAASAPAAKASGPSFGKSWTPEERAAHQRALVEKLRGR